MANQKKKLTIFLSHSHADIEKVRKVRDVLETLNCEPITFFLACMDDNNPLLEQLIKNEIDARNVFVYCKSKKAEKSKWVQKELEYIKSSGQKRMYVIDLEESFETSVVQLLSELMKIIFSNTVVLCYAQSASTVAAQLAKLLEERGFATLNYDPSKGYSFAQKVAHFCGCGMFVPIFYKPEGNNEKGNEWGFFRTERALEAARENKNACILPVYVEVSQGERYSHYSKEGCYLSENMMAEGVYQISEKIEKMAQKWYEKATTQK
jgi:hypothetical protein